MNNNIFRNHEIVEFGETFREVLWEFIVYKIALQ